jgi:hypothetical protein
MPDDIPQTDGETENPLVDYERTDASFRGIMAFVVGGIVILVLVHIGVWFFLQGYGAHENQVKKSPFPLGPGPAVTNPLPREPRLEQLKHLEGSRDVGAYEMEAEKLGVLNRYGPTADKGFIHIPIDRALDLLANDRQLRERLLPWRPEPPAAQRRRSDGLVDAGEPNSGRMFRGDTR